MHIARRETDAGSYSAAETTPIVVYLLPVAPPVASLVFYGYAARSRQPYSIG